MLVLSSIAGTAIKLFFELYFGVWADLSVWFRRTVLGISVVILIGTVFLYSAIAVKVLRLNRILSLKNHQRYDCTYEYY